VAIVIIANTAGMFNIFPTFLRKKLEIRIGGQVSGIGGKKLSISTVGQIND
jgi:hypothetical protein